MGAARKRTLDALSKASLGLRFPLSLDFLPHSFYVIMSKLTPLYNNKTVFHLPDSGDEEVGLGNCCQCAYSSVP